MSINLIDIAWYAFHGPHCGMNKSLILRGIAIREGFATVSVQVLAALGEN
jgi:hypothetical protein